MNFFFLIFRIKRTSLFIISSSHKVVLKRNNKARNGDNLFKNIKYFRGNKVKAILITIN